MPSRILLLNSSYGDGGAAKAVLRLQQAVNKYSVEFKASTLVAEGAVNREDVELWRTRNVVGEAKRMIQRRLSSRLSTIASSLNQSQSTVAWPSTGIATFLRSYHTDVSLYHLHSLGSSLISLSEIKKLNKPIVWTLHDEWPTYGFIHYRLPATSLSSLNNFFRPLIENALRKVDLFITPSNWLARQIKSNLTSFCPKVKTIPNPIDLEFWSSVGKEKARNILGMKCDNFYILYVGTHLSDPRKGHNLLRKATFIIRDLMVQERIQKKVKLLVAGVAYGLDQSEYGIEVGSLGKCDDQRLRNLYSACDIACIPSLADNLPNVGTEAQSCGLPIVTFDVGGMSEVIVDGQTGLICDQLSHEALAYSLFTVISRPELLIRMGPASRQRAKCNWSEQDIVRKHEDVYRSLLFD